MGLLLPNFRCWTGPDSGGSGFLARSWISKILVTDLLLDGKEDGRE